MKICKTCHSVDFYPKGTCKQCQRSRALNRYYNLSKIDKKKYIEENQKRGKIWRNENIFRYRWLEAKQRAKHKNLEFSITEKFLEQLYKDQLGKCYYSGTELLLNQDNRTNSISIDRKDSSFGYTQSNTVLCCSRVNIFKSTTRETEFLEMVAMIYNHKIQPLSNL